MVRLLLVTCTTVDTTGVTMRATTEATMGADITILFVTEGITKVDNMEATTEATTEAIMEVTTRAIMKAADIPMLFVTGDTMKVATTAGTMKAVTTAATMEVTMKAATMESTTEAKATTRPRLAQGELSELQLLNQILTHTITILGAVPVGLDKC